MISLTSLNPPTSLLTVLGLLVSTFSALSSFPRRGGPELGGRRDLLWLSSAEVLSPTEVEEVGAGISSHASPAMSICLRKKGQSFVSRFSDSWASAKEIGTGEDFTIASDTSEVGSVRRLRAVGVELDPTGDEKSLWRVERLLVICIH